MSAIKTQGTQLYYASAPTAITTIGPISGLTNLDGGNVDQIDITLLTATSRAYLAGLANPGALSLDIVFDPLDATLQALIALKAAGTTVNWCIGFSDGTMPPTAAASLIVQPAAASRTSVKFDGFVSGFVVDAPGNDAVKAKCTLQISGVLTWVYHT